MSSVETVTRWTRLAALLKQGWKVDGYAVVSPDEKERKHVWANAIASCRKRGLITHTVEVVHHPGFFGVNRPYIVKVDGKTLRSRRHSIRHFSTSTKAAVAGAKEVDRLKESKNG